MADGVLKFGWFRNGYIEMVQDTVMKYIFIFRKCIITILTMTFVCARMNTKIYSSVATLSRLLFFYQIHNIGDEDSVKICANNEIEIAYNQ